VKTEALDSFKMGKFLPGCREIGYSRDNYHSLRRAEPQHGCDCILIVNSLHFTAVFWNLIKHPDSKFLPGGWRQHLSQKCLHLSAALNLVISQRTNCKINNHENCKSAW
jgi:hypothetical protein